MNELFGHYNKDVYLLNRKSLIIQHWYFERLANTNIDKNKYASTRVVKVLGRQWIKQNKLKSNNSVSKVKELNKSALKSSLAKYSVAGDFSRNKKLSKELSKPRKSLKGNKNVSVTENKEIKEEISKSKKSLVYKGRQDKLNLIGEIAIKTCGGYIRDKKFTQRKQGSIKRKKQQDVKMKGIFTISEKNLLINIKEFYKMQEKAARYIQALYRKHLSYKHIMQY